jgi:hypothetical protein
MGHLRVSHSYHTSLRPEIATQSQLPARTLPAGCRAFVSNLEHGLDARFAACDVIYCEPAWRRGYDLFCARADVVGDYNRYIRAIAEMVESARCPLVLAIGREALRHLPSPRAAVTSWIDTGGRIITECSVVSFGADVVDVRSGPTSSIVGALAQVFACVGDPCCGYGNTGRIFMENGKRFVLADVNASCIQYVSQHSAEWRGNNG